MLPFFRKKLAATKDPPPPPPDPKKVPLSQTPPSVKGKGLERWARSVTKK